MPPRRGRESGGVAKYGSEALQRELWHQAEGKQNLSIFAAGFPQSVEIDCSTGSVTGAPQAIETTLTYDPLTDTYVFKWKTDKNGWVNTCRKLTVRLIDGTTREAYFRFVK